MSIGAAVMSTPYYKSKVDRYIDSEHLVSLAEHGPKLQDIAEQISTITYTDGCWGRLSGMASTLRVAGSNVIPELVDPLAAKAMTKLKEIWGSHAEYVDAGNDIPGVALKDSVFVIRTGWVASR